MQTRFKERAKVIDIVITALAVMLSVGTMLYGIFHYGLAETWPELVLNVFYIACVVMIWLYFFDHKAIQLLVYRLRWHHGVAARHSFSIYDNLLSHQIGMFYIVGDAALPADLLLCPQRLGVLYQAEPMADFHHRCTHRHPLQH